MSHFMKHINTAYRRGIEAAKANKKYTTCPYSESKVYLAMWFWRGFDDYNNGVLPNDY